MTEPDDTLDDLVFDPLLLLGTWANGTRVRHTRVEFTLDFLRDVHELPRRVLVARAVVPPVAAFDLRDHLDAALRSYTDWSMPGNADA